MRKTILTALIGITASYTVAQPTAIEMEKPGIRIGLKVSEMNKIGALSPKMYLPIIDPSENMPYDRNKRALISDFDERYVTRVELQLIILQLKKTVDSLVYVYNQSNKIEKPPYSPLPVFKSVPNSPVILTPSNTSNPPTTKVNKKRRGLRLKFKKCLHCGQRH